MIPYIEDHGDVVEQNTPFGQFFPCRAMNAVNALTPLGHWAAALHQHLATFGQGEVVFAHHGPVDRTLLEALVAQAENHSLASTDGVSLRKRLFNVLVEGLENVHHHTPAEMADSGFALLFRSSAGYRILLGNALPSAHAAQLSHRLSILNEMDEADLREHHLRLLANEGRTERGGAGLGLLTMARKSSGPIVAHQVPRDQASVYVALEIALAA